MTKEQQRLKIARKIEAYRKKQKVTVYRLSKGGNAPSTKRVLQGENVTLDVLLNVVNNLDGTLEIKFNNQ